MAATFAVSFKLLLPDETLTPSDSSFSTNESIVFFEVPSFIPPPLPVRFGFGFSIGSAVGNEVDDDPPLPPPPIPPRTLPPPPMA